MNTNLPNAGSNNQTSIETRFLKEAFTQGLENSVSFVKILVRESVNLKASDILLEPEPNKIRVRARIDGVLYKLGEIPQEYYDGIVSRVKILSQLDPTEKRRVQEGQFTIEHENRTINVRVEIALTVHGELIVIRIHESETIIMELSELGFHKQAFQSFQEILKNKSGLLIVCGPTGCGKTTTLYSTINHLNHEASYNVMTVEDPVEYHMDGVNQMQTHEAIGFTFAEGLKTILRLSPDVILVGEIRDKETAEIAIESGLTGHLVISTVHADDAAGALFRLLDLGIKPYLINSAINGIVAQRLVRKICSECKQQYQPSQEELELFNDVLGRKPTSLTKGQGCYSCQNMAYKGRTGIFEVLRMDTTIRDKVREEINENELRSYLEQQGFITLLKDGLLKAELGITTTEEVLRNSLRILSKKPD